MTIITIAESKVAPFDLFSSDRESSLISENKVDELNKLSWESVEVKNYCLAVNQQTEIKLDKIPYLQTVQKQSRTTANLWLKEISIAINEVYNATDFFCDSFTGISDELKTYARDLSNPENRKRFVAEIDTLNEDVKAITCKINILNTKLPAIRNGFEKNSRDFGGIVQETKKIEIGNKQQIETLEREIKELNKNLNQLNNKIIGYATIGTAIGLAFIGSLVLTVITGGIALPIIAAGIGLAAGITHGHLVGWIGERTRKESERSVKTKSLQDLNLETAVAVSIREQYESLINSGSKAITVVQDLYEGGNDILGNFTRFSDQVQDAKQKDSDKVFGTVKRLDRIVQKIKKTIKLHEERGLIKSKIEVPVASILKPSYAKLGHTQALYLPTRLHLAYSNRMHRRYSAY